MPDDFATHSLLTALLLAGSMGIACAVLSVLVVAKRWAFMGEAIAHAGFGGAGVAWMLSLIPALEFLRNPGATYGVAVIFSLVVALAIGLLSRRDKLPPDSVIGILLAGSMALGFFASSLYGHVKQTQPPTLGQFVGYEVQKLQLLPTSYMAVAVIVMIAVVALTLLFYKELYYYCFDPEMARVSGVRVGLIHYMLLMLLALTVILTMRLTGSLLVIALLILPGATGLSFGRSMKGVWGASVTVGLLGSLAGPLANAKWNFIPEGPAIVMALFVLFLLSIPLRRLVPAST